MQFPIEINVIDTSLKSLNSAQVGLQEIKISKEVKSINYHQSITNLPKFLDYVVVATNSDIRLEVVRAVLSHSKVKYMLLEKVLFQRVVDYEQARSLLKLHNVSTWVNCPRRAYDIYHKVKMYFECDTLLYGQVLGGNWGLGCNGIHFLDIFSKLNQAELKYVDSSGIDSDVHSSKRYGFMEFTGSLTGVYSNGFRFEITSLKDSLLPLLVTLRSVDKVCIIDESCGKAFFYKTRCPQLWDCEDFSVPHLSSLVPELASDILNNGKSLLPSLAESIQCHIPFIEALIRARAKVIPSDDVCPIT